jgi:hypothetical protein
VEEVEKGRRKRRRRRRRFANREKGGGLSSHKFFCTGFTNFVHNLIFANAGMLGTMN